MLLIWLVGLHGYSQKKHYDFQSNSRKKRKEFSVFFLGRLILEKLRPPERIIRIQNAISFTYNDI